MDQFPPNSAKSKEQKVPAKKAPAKKAPAEKVVTSTVIVKKKSLGEKFKDTFIGGDAKTAVQYIAVEVLLPALRNMVVDATTKGIERVIYGDSRPRSHMSNGPKISYNAPVSRFPGAASPFQPAQNRMSQTRGESMELLFASREDADAVLETFAGILDQYEVVSVMDLKEITGLPSSHIDNNWGWRSLRGTHIKQTRQGFVIDFAPMESI